MSRRAWITPDDAPTGLSCWRVFIPNTIEFEAAFRGALLLLADIGNWEQVGSLTPSECSAYMWDGIGPSLEMIACAETTGGTTMPIGAVFWFAGDSPPSNCLTCDGAQISTTVYADLFAIVGYTYGGSGAVFSLPDLVNRAAVGSGDSFALADAGGEEEHTLTYSEMPVHYHGLPKAAAVGANADVITAGKYQGVDVNTFNAGDGEAHNNMPPYLALLPCIVASE